MRTIPLIFLLLARAVLTAAPPAHSQSPELTLQQAQALVARALAAELHSVKDKSHPMRFRLRKASPRLTSTKEIIETKDGAVARLVSLFDKPLSQDQEQAEEARLETLYNDPSRQRHRQQGEEGDFGIVLKLLRMLPDAYLYEYSGSSLWPRRTRRKVHLSPQPPFHPSRL